MKITTIILLVLIISCNIFAQNNNSIIAVKYMQEMNLPKSSQLSSSISYKTYIVDVASMNNVIKKSNILNIYGFPINLNELGTLKLTRTNPVVDANTKFVIGGPNGDIKIPTPVVESFSGTIDGVSNSKVDFISVNGQIFCKIDNNGSGYFFSSSVQSPDPSLYQLVDEYSFYKDNPAFKMECSADNIQSPLPQKYNKMNITLSNALLEAKIAVETDTQFYIATGGTLPKTTAYLTAMFALASRVYEEQVRITMRLTFVKIWTDNPSDPYGAKGDYTILESKVAAYWQNNYQNVERDVVHVMTSISYGGGGFGYFDALCDKKQYGYSVSSLQCSNNLSSFAFSYDVYTVCHEIGHNFNAQHTHSCFWGVPIDTCSVSEAITGKCLDPSVTAKPNPGSIMSYCGVANNQFGLGYQVRMIFLPQNTTIIRTAAEAAKCITAPVNPIVKLINPLGKKSYNAGDTIMITWRSSQVSNVKLEFTSDGGSNWNIIQDISPAANEQLTWKTPAICSRNVLVRISDAANSMDKDSTVVPFAINETDTSGLVAWYPFNGNSNDEEFCHFYNSSGVGNPTLTKDRFNKANSAYSFNGSNYLVAPNFIVPTNQLSYMFWFNLSDLSGTRHFLGTNWEESWAFASYYWGQFGADIYYDGNNSPTQIWGGYVIANAWHMGAFTFDGRYMKIYIDGALKNTNDLGSAGHTINRWDNANLYIGARKDKEASIGTIDDIRIYNKALSDADISKFYNEVNGIQELNVNNDFDAQIVPNPANSLATLNLCNVGEDIYSISVVNSLGEKVLELSQNKVLTKGTFQLNIDLTNQSSGAYFVIIQGLKSTNTMKLMLIR